METLKILEEFGGNPNNSQNLLYEYISQINKILKVILGTASLGSLFEDFKLDVLSNLSNIIKTVQPNGSYDSIQDNFINNGASYFPSVDTIRLDIDLSPYNIGMNEPFTVVLDFSEENIKQGSVMGLRIENLKVNQSYGTFNIYLKDGKSDINNLKIPNFSIKDKNNNPYIDLSELPLLLQIGIKTTDENRYYISGTFNMDKNLLGGIAGIEPRKFEIHIFIQISDKKGPNGLNQVYCYMNVEGWGATWNGPTYSDGPLKRKVWRRYIKTEAMVKEETVYVKQTRLQDMKIQKNIFAWIDEGPFKYDCTHFDYFKTTSTEFCTDIMYYLFSTILDSQNVYNFINDKMGNASMGSIKPLDMIKSFKKGAFSWGNNGNVAYDPNGNAFGGEINLNIVLGLGLQGFVNIGFDPNSKNITTLTIGANMSGVCALYVDTKLMQFNDNKNVETFNKSMKFYEEFIEAFNEDPKTANLEYRVGHKEDPTMFYRVSELRDQSSVGTIYNSRTGKYY